MLEKPTAKVSLDIGGKISWLVTARGTLKRHLSMIAVPKVRNFDLVTFRQTLTRSHTGAEMLRLRHDSKT